MKSKMEKVSLLALSLMLVSTYSISSISPFMLDYYKEYSSSQVEQLISIPSLAIVVMVVAGTWVSKVMKERTMIVTGLILLSVSGMAPLFVMSYPIVFATRVLLGLGIGMINARAVSMISERYEGAEQAKLLGYRTSAETLGNATLTFLVGRILLINWRYAFAVYGFGLVVLVLYLLFIPDADPKMENTVGTKEADRGKMTGAMIVTAVFYAIAAGIQISVNCALTLRIPVLVLERGYATSSQASVVLTLFMLIGIVAGAVYGKLVQISAKSVFTAALIGLCLGVGIVIVANSLIVLGIGALVAGFTHNICMTCVFNGIAQVLPTDKVHVATSIVLVGCNIGASSTPLVMKFAGQFAAGAAGSFYFYILVLVLLCAVNLILMKVKPKMAVCVAA